MTTPTQLPELIPVIDLMGGIVVRGVGGRRHEYAPIRSELCESQDPAAVARALIKAFHPRRVYLADLDAISGATPAWVVYREIQALGVELWVDAGIRTVREAQALHEAGIGGIVCGLESLPGPRVLAEILNEIDPERVLLSLDLKDGSLLNADRWTVADYGDEPFAVAWEAVVLGIRRLIVLDLARVGEGKGTGTDELCQRLAAAYPQVGLFAGGGINGWDDVCRLGSVGVSGVLVASALHDGRIRAHRP
jgi:phosphoribosylformimino-5-aminoimidazole carboxamide ribotide isomerase